jgi:hypothetical protein
VRTHRELLGSGDLEQVFREFRKIHPCKAINPLISVLPNGYPFNRCDKCRNCCAQTYHDEHCLHALEAR